jgi:hypothetical protein
MKTLVIAMTAALLAGCGPTAEEQELLDKEAYQAAVAPLVAEVKRHYGGTVDAGNWGVWDVRDVRAGDANTFSKNIRTVEVTVRIPGEQANDLMGRASDAQDRAIGWAVCPRRSDPLWTKFTGNDFLIIQAEGPGGVFNDVDCRDNTMP